MASASSVRATAPGTLMILGEHAVLHGRRALACAVNRRMTVTLTPRKDGIVQVESSLGSLRARRNELTADGPFRFVNAAILRHAEGGVDLVIESEFSHTVGLGSSAAVTVATIAGLHALRGTTPSPEHLHQDGYDIIHAVQGLGSGTDVAASVLGGIVEYRVQPRILRRHEGTPDILLVYCGFKTPTIDVVKQIDAARAREPERFDALFDRMDASVENAVEAIGHEDWARVGRVLNENQRLMAEMGVSNDALDDIVIRLSQDDRVLGAKISGSGLGDCVLGLGSFHAETMPYPTIPVDISPQGARVE